MDSFKTRRRESKYKQILKSELNIDFKEEPSKNLMIGNAGLVSGIQYEQLAQLFTQYGNVEKIVMIPRKSYSFVIYSTIEDAVVAYNAVNGKARLDNMNGPMYLLYTVSVPTEFDTPTMSTLPEGVILLNEFVTCEEEEQLLNCITWDTDEQERAKTLKHRRVKHFGYEFFYDNNNVNKNSPLREHIPEECSFVNSRLQELSYCLKWTPNQLTVNQYQKGQGIPSHIDTHSAFESPLLSLSLGSDVVMEFRKEAQHIPVLLPRRSLLIMDGEARYAWTHGITPRTMDVVSVAGGLSVRERGCRTSFTLRKVREGACQCQYTTYCDSQRTLSQPAILEHEAHRLEELHVHKVYSYIASHFSETRTKVWPNVREFLFSFPSGALLIDAGCGNGKHFGVNPNIFQIGFDRSSSLAAVTCSRGHEVFISNCLWLPVRDRVADGVISVAVLHHLSTRERRLRALREISRVLVQGGRALVTVWAKDQTRKNMTAYLKQDRKNRRKDHMHITDKSTMNSENDFGELGDYKDKKINICNESNEEKSNEHRTSPKLKSEYMEDTLPDFKLPVHTSRTEFQHQDIFVPWKLKMKNSGHETKDVFLRYYHVFEENELVHLCKELPDINVLHTYYTEGNWCIIFEKVS